MLKSEYSELDIKNAIILLAVEDYRRALDGNDCDGIPPAMIISDVERFFRSTYFETLTKIDGEFLIEQLKKEHEEKVRKEECT